MQLQLGQAIVMPQDHVRLDLMGLKCPMPALMLERTLKRVSVGTLIVAVATDPLAEVDLPFSAQKLGAIVVDVISAQGLVTVTVRK